MVVTNQLLAQRRPMTGTLLPIMAALLISSATFAQASENFSLQQHVFPSGGMPQDAAPLTSGNFRITVQTIGENTSASLTEGATFIIGSGFLAGKLPPGEVMGLQFSDGQTLSWSPDSRSGRYAIYRGDITSLSTSYGQCQEHTAVTAYTEWGVPAPGQCFFYLVAGINDLNEEGTLGTTSAGVERHGVTPCP